MTRIEMTLNTIEKLDRNLERWAKRGAEYVAAKKATKKAQLFELHRLQRAEFEAERALFRACSAVVKEASFLRYLQRKP